MYPKGENMENLVQIICGCAGADTIEECARVPQELGATIIVVHGIWPYIKYFTDKDPSAQAKNITRPDFQIDNVKEIAEKNNWHFIQMSTFEYNGIQYNKALDYITKNNIPCDHIWFVDSDECIDPVFAPFLLEDIEKVKQANGNQLRFRNRIEILPEWKYIQTSIEIGNEGIVWGDALYQTRQNGFDGNWRFANFRDLRYGNTRVPLYHLHNLSKHGANRIKGNIYESGKLKVDIDNVNHYIKETEYTNYLKQKYTKFYTDREGEDSYIGSEVFEQGEK